MSRELSLATIEKLQGVADRLLETATQPTLKEQARLAQRDLGEAFRWLSRTNHDPRPSILHIVTMNIELATERLRMVEEALKIYGSGAKSTTPIQIRRQ